jgi:TolA-binding protein
MKRLLDDTGTDFEHSLLSALRNEKPSPELVARMQRGLGLGLGTAATGSAATASSVGWIKVSLVGLATLGLAGVAYVALRSSPSPTVGPPSVRPAPAKVESVVTLEPKPVVVAELAVAPAEDRVPARVRPAGSVAPDLREEIRLLDQARSAVRAGEGSQALALLAKYGRRYPRGQFRQEAQVLRVEALKLSGNQQAAVALGRKFVAAHPESPHVERVERATGGER